MEQPHPTNQLGLLRIPGPDVSQIALRLSPLSARDHFDPDLWPQHPLSKSSSFPGWWEIDVDQMGLADGVYEYEFVAGGNPVADPYAEELTRFAGYRGLLTMSAGQRVRKAFGWDDEFKPGVDLPNNNQIVVYEMPIKWMSSDPSENPLVELGTFDKLIYEHLDQLIALGINCIGLLPIEDTPQTLNWGYGTRFFFAPDYDIGTPVDAKFFVKYCHQRGVRVFLDVVMNMFATECPLAGLAKSWFWEPASPGREDFSQDLFHYSSPSYGDYYAAREFLCEMGEYWVSEYHVDGYRVDDFKDINNYEFVQDFCDRATAQSKQLFPNKPFLVVAEDSNRRFSITDGDAFDGHRVVDSIWNFGYRDEIRKLLTDSIDTNFGEPSRSARVEHLISMEGVWNNLPRSFDPGYGDMTCSVDYITSHDVADAARLMNVILGPMLASAGLAGDDIDGIKWAVDNADTWSDTRVRDTVLAACRRVFGGFAILMTSVGIPMFLAGEEFGDVHDMSFTDVNPKQEDPVQWLRADFSSNSALLTNVGELIRLRTSHPALQRDEVEAFYFHPQFDNNDAPRVFAYCRTGGQQVGSTGQVIVVANMGAANYPNYEIPRWPWGNTPLTEVGSMTTGALAFDAGTGSLNVA
ncbi:MAG TPA: alpha-amylase family glycosyl hydrolase, partial [Bryobacteraceae bacterium]|nr:alpha-amylase family glycosyl hydrolase [Bryobacteraceae bacterium]